MIAIISSCINPFNPNTAVQKSAVNIEDRIKQTQFTINELLVLGFEKIYLIDNSYVSSFHLLQQTDKLSVRHYVQYQFNNKGINEILMLLNLIDEIPHDKPIFKISGRYYPNEHFSLNYNTIYDFRFKGYNYSQKTGTVSTRAYFAKDKVIYKTFLLQSLNEIFLYSFRVVGYRSLIKAFKNIFQYRIPIEPNTSIEVAFAKVLRKANYSVELVENIGISGIIAGFYPPKKITE